MNATDTENACKREIQVEVPADVVAQETNALVEKYQKVARIPGFRRGKVPASIIRQRFADDLRQEVMETLMPRFIREEAGKQGLNMVSTPRVTDVHLHEGEPLRFKASFEILPEIEISGYQELRAEHPAVVVTDEEVDQALNNIRESHATYTPVEGRPLQEDDFAQASFRGVPKDQGATEGQKPLGPVNVDDVMVEIGGTNTVREFSDNLRGARAGEERTFDVAYRDDFSDQRLAGKTVTYTVQVKAIKTKQLPALDDAFAKELGSFENLDALKQHIRASLEEDKRHTAEHEAKEKLLDELIRRHDFPVPDALVERQIDVRLERGLRALAAQGMRAEDMKRMDFSRLRTGQHDAAVREVKASLLLERIADAEHIEVSDDELERELAAVASQTRQTLESVRARLTQDGALDRIRNRIRSDKTLDFLYRQSA